MNRTLGIQLIVFSLLLIGLSWLAHHLAPSLARLTLIAGGAGGTLCLIWALRAIQGSRRKAPCLLTLVPTTYLLLSQTVLAWSASGAETAGRNLAASVITLLAVLSCVMLMRIAYAGAFVAEGASSAPARPGPEPRPAKDEIVATLMTVLVAVAVATFARLACPEQPREALQAGVGRQPQV